MKALASHIQLKKLASAPEEAWAVFECLTHTFEPSDDRASTLDLDAVFRVLARNDPPKSITEEPDFLKIRKENNVQDYPEIPNH